MSNEGSVTAWLPLLERGDSGADEWLVSTYFEQVARIARRQLGLAPRRAADEEDVANSVFRLFLARAKDGGFKQLADRNDLHRIFPAGDPFNQSCRCQGHLCIRADLYDGRVKRIVSPVSRTMR